MTELNKAAEQLRDLMSDISERCWYAGWLEGTEFVLWGAVTGGARTWGHGTITEEDIARLEALSEIAGGWIAWNDDRDEEECVPMEEWLDRYAKDTQ